MKGNVAQRRLLLERLEHVWELLRMIQRQGKVAEVGERGDNCWKDTLELG